MIAFNETRLDQSISDGLIHLDGYEVIRKDRSRNRDGVCIFICSSINYKIRSDLIPPTLEAFCLEINKLQSKPFIVSTIYRPPNAPAEFFYCFETLIKQIDDENKEMFILGDLNCNLLQERALFNVPASKLSSIYELYQLSQLINEPTRVTLTTSSLIDHVVTNTPEKISHSGVVLTGISDHSLIYAIRKIRYFQKNDYFLEIRNMSFSINIGNAFTFLVRIQIICEKYGKSFFRSTKQTCPITAQKTKPSKVPCITTEIKSLINERDKLKRKAIITKLETDH